MEHTMKWLLETLNITRKKYRVYQDAGLLLPNNSQQKPRVFTEEDINRIWTLLFLEEIGFTLSELKELFKNPDADFFEAISGKYEEFERNVNKMKDNANFLRLLKLEGIIPSTVQKPAGITVKEFVDNARLKMKEVKINGVSYSNFFDFFAELDNNADLEKVMEDFVKSPQGILLINGRVNIEYFKMLAEFVEPDYKADTVQRIISLFHESWIELNIEGGGDMRKKDFFSLIMSMQFITECPAGENNIKHFGEEKCMLIAEALAYYGGYDSLIDLIEKNNLATV